MMFCNLAFVGACLTCFADCDAVFSLTESKRVGARARGTIACCCLPACFVPCTFECNQICVWSSVSVGAALIYIHSALGVPLGLARGSGANSDQVSQVISRIRSAELHTDTMISSGIASSPDATLTLSSGTSVGTVGKRKHIPAMPVISKKQSESVSESLGESYSGEDK